MHQTEWLLTMTLMVEMRPDIFAMAMTTHLPVSLVHTVCQPYQETDKVTGQLLLPAIIC